MILELSAVHLARSWTYSLLSMAAGILIRVHTMTQMRCKMLLAVWTYFLQLLVNVPLNQPRHPANWHQQMLCSQIHAKEPINTLKWNSLVNQVRTRFTFKLCCFLHYSKTYVKRPLSKRPQIGFQYQLSLNAGQKYCRMLQNAPAGAFYNIFDLH